MIDKIITKLEPTKKFPAQQEEAEIKLRVAAYARVSTDHEEQETSLEAQTDYYRTKITEHPGWEFVEIYADAGISGLSTKRRDSFNRMIEDCLAGRIDLILTKSISRFARNTVDTVTTIRKLKEKGIGVYFEKENIDTTDSKSEFLLTIMSSLAQEESRSISENITWGMRKKMADGRVSVPYCHFLGYDRGPERNSMIVNEEQAVTVRRIYRMFLQGYATSTIAVMLTKDGVPSPSGLDKWQGRVVHHILTNEKYKGDALLQKVFTVDFLLKKKKKNEGELPQYYVEKDHEAIISPWLFDYVQNIILSRKKSGRKTYSGKTMFSSKIICGFCGSIYGPRPWHSTSYNYLVWQCQSRIVKGNKCLAFNIHDKLLHYAVHDIARKAIFERHIEQTVAESVIPLLPDDRQQNVLDWLQDFRSRDIWTLQSDEDDLAIILRKIVVMPDGKAEIHWIDGSEMPYCFGEFRPAEHNSYRRKK